MDCLKCGTQDGGQFGVCSRCMQSHLRQGNRNSNNPELHSLIAEIEHNNNPWLQFKEKVREVISNPQARLNIAGAIFIIVFIYLVIDGLGYSSSSARQFKHPPGILVAAQPLQQNLQSAKSWEHKGWKITPRATFDIRARVLLKGHFTLMAGSDISPYDFTLGWGRMSDSTILKQFKFTHGFRFVFWNSDSWPITPDEANISVSNLHAIPANDTVKSMLSRIRNDNIIRFKGYLITADKDGGSWNSSLTRDDTGDGACEVMWIDTAVIEK